MLANDEDNDDDDDAGEEDDDDDKSFHPCTEFYPDVMRSLFDGPCNSLAIVSSNLNYI